MRLLLEAFASDVFLDGMLFNSSQPKVVFAISMFNLVFQHQRVVCLVFAEMTYMCVLSTPLLEADRIGF